MSPYPYFYHSFLWLPSHPPPAGSHQSPEEMPQENKDSECLAVLILLDTGALFDWEFSLLDILSSTGFWFLLSSHPPELGLWMLVLVLAVAHFPSHCWLSWNNPTHISMLKTPKLGLLPRLIYQIYQLPLGGRHFPHFKFIFSRPELYTKEAG